MRLKIGILDDSDIIKERFNELKHSDTFDICGILSNKEQWKNNRVTFFDSIDSMINSESIDVLSICVPTQNILKTIKLTKNYCKNLIISNLATLDLESLKEISKIIQKDSLKIGIDLPYRFNPVITSLKKALSKEEKISSIHITNINNKSQNLPELLIHNIDLASFIISNTQNSISELSYSTIEQTQALIKLIINQKTAFSMHCCTLGPIDRFIIEVNASSGIYYADLISKKLYIQSINGQINLKVNIDSSEAREQYRAFYDFFIKSEQEELSNIHNIINIKELLS